MTEDTTATQYAVPPPRRPRRAGPLAVDVDAMNRIQKILDELPDQARIRVVWHIFKLNISSMEDVP